VRAFGRRVGIDPSCACAGCGHPGVARSRVSIRGWGGRWGRGSCLGPSVGDGGEPSSFARALARAGGGGPFDDAVRVRRRGWVGNGRAGCTRFGGRRGAIAWARPLALPSPTSPAMRGCDPVAALRCAGARWVSGPARRGGRGAMWGVTAHLWGDSPSRPVGYGGPARPGSVAIRGPDRVRAAGGIHAEFGASEGVAGPLRSPRRGGRIEGDPVRRRSCAGGRDGPCRRSRGPVADRSGAGVR